MLNVSDSYGIIKNIKNGWEKIETPTILTVIIVLSFFSFAIANLNLSGQGLKEFLGNLLVLRNLLFIHAFSASLLWLIWSQTSKLPKIKKDEIGIVFAITTENIKQHQIIKSDFIDKIENEIRRATFKKLKAIYLSEYHADRLLKNPRKLLKYHNKMNAELFFLGNISIREKNKYLLRIKSSVKHKSTTIAGHKSLQEAMNFVCPQESIIGIDKEILNFEVFSSFFSIAAQFILGSAFFVSGRIEEALVFHHSLIEKIDSISQKAVGKDKYMSILKHNNKKLVFFEALHCARKEYYANQIDNMKKYLEIMKNLEPMNYDHLLLAAIYHFLSQRQIDEAMKCIDNAKKNCNGDYTWAYSKAFLYAYQGDLYRAYRFYQKAFNESTDINAHIQVEEFISDIIDQEPDKFQLYYCLGIVNFGLKKDLKLASKYFQKFVNKAKNENVFDNTVKWVENQIDKMSNEDNFNS